VTVLLAACGATAHSAAPRATQISRALAGSPPPLAALHAQADQLLGGGTAAFEARLNSLRGYPVVVNKWASWCGPCRSEFPAFQRVVLAFGRRVAFIGLDGKDSGGTAAAFLRSFPVTYPSYVDPAEGIARKLQAGIYYPLTVYIDSRGAQVYTHVGPYESAAALELDVRRYALGGR
jgi:cytochrome c biogenesis protein CcmG, thiol:disulfide interchange protein DsbE